MNSHSIWLVAALVPVMFAASASAESVSGTLSFIAPTNVKMFKFSGETKEFASSIVRKGLSLSSLEISVPVENLKTGMEIRDKHMRERIFKAPDGTEPQIVFRAKQSSCKPSEGGAQACDIPGTLAFRGQERPYVLHGVVTASGPGLRVKAHGLIDVIDFGVDPAKLKWTNIAVDRNAVIDLDVEVK